MAESVVKKTGRRVFLLPVIFLVVFGLFIFAITRPPLVTKAMGRLQSCYDVKDVRACWDTYKADLHTNEEFIFAVREKLQSFNLGDAELTACKAWLPPAPVSLNLILVPDLSKRIIDEGNNPGQIQNDTLLLNETWEVFKRLTRTKTNSKDRLIVEVTDSEQAGGAFRTLADNLIFDLSTHGAYKSNRLYFDEIGNRFSENIAQLYSLARQNPIGADYWYYFNRNLNKRVLKSTLFDEYRNVVILITDGYLEAQTNERTGVSFYTGSFAQRAEACHQLKRGVPVAQAVQNSIFNIRDCQRHFPEVEVLMLEVNERKRRTRAEPFDPGTSCDYDILKSLWTQWFKTLEIKNAHEDFFIQRNDALGLTRKELSHFLETSINRPQ